MLIDSYGPSQDSDHPDVKDARKSKSEFISKVNQFLTVELFKLVDDPHYVFDPSEKVWVNVASRIASPTWERYQAIEAQKKKPNVSKQQSAESGSQILLSESVSKTVADNNFGDDQEKDDENDDEEEDDDNDETMENATAGPSVTKEGDEMKELRIHPNTL
ncbi:hypothetical protein L1887_23952 [Cichorium endivia]|nr:hypothetical protein L1887_23952 [Cichorium endivia]